MPPNTPKLLEDVRSAAAYILEKTSGKSLEDYLADDLLRPATQRHFEIIGEALNRLGRGDPETLQQIPDHARIIAFRNILIHGYDAIDDRRVWDAIVNALPQLLCKVEDLLADVDPIA